MLLTARGCDTRVWTARTHGRSVMEAGEPGPAMPFEERGLWPRTSTMQARH
jgi:hypothetical protein